MYIWLNTNEFSKYEINEMKIKQNTVESIQNLQNECIKNKKYRDYLMMQRMWLISMEKRHINKIRDVHVQWCSCSGLFVSMRTIHRKRNIIIIIYILFREYNNEGVISN